MSSIVARQWNNRRCRIEAGIFFPDDTFVPLRPERQGYARGDRVAIETLLARDPHGWFELDARATFRRDEVEVSCGGGPWEGEGFVATVAGVARVAGDRLQWLLHLTDSEAFVEVKIEGAMIVARSEEYPVRIDWTIPLDDPASLVKRVTRL